MAIAAMVNAALILYGLPRLGRIQRPLRGSARLLYDRLRGQTEDNDLDKAGSYFAKALSGGFVTVLELWITNRAFPGHRAPSPAGCAPRTAAGGVRTVVRGARSTEEHA